jgi:hypothetical protein
MSLKALKYDFAEKVCGRPKCYACVMAFREHKKACLFSRALPVFRNLVEQVAFDVMPSGNTRLPVYQNRYAAYINGVADVRDSLRDAMRCKKLSTKKK